jgi:hypothetical protein
MALLGAPHQNRDVTPRFGERADDVSAHEPRAPGDEHAQLHSDIQAIERVTKRCPIRPGLKSTK